MRERRRYRGEGEEKEGEEEREEAKEEARMKVRETQSGLAPPPSSAVTHRVEDGVPLRRFHVCTKVLIKSLSWAAILSLNFEGLSDL